jgi:hypothetical protein
MIILYYANELFESQYLEKFEVIIWKVLHSALKNKIVFLD